MTTPVSKPIHAQISGRGNGG